MNNLYFSLLVITYNGGNNFTLFLCNLINVRVSDSFTRIYSRKFTKKCPDRVISLP